MSNDDKNVDPEKKDNRRANIRIVKDGNAEIEIDEDGVIKQITIKNCGSGYFPKQNKGLPEEILYRRNLTKDKLPEDTKHYYTDFGTLWYNPKIERWCNHYGDVFYPTFWFEKI